MTNLQFSIETAPGFVDKMNVMVIKKQPIVINTMRILCDSYDRAFRGAYLLLSPPLIFSEPTLNLMLSKPSTSALYEA